MWSSQLPFWVLLITSTYNMLLMALERYVAVVYPVWYSANVRSPVESSVYAFLFTGLYCVNCFLFFFFNDRLENNYLMIYWTNFRNLFTD